MMVCSVNRRVSALLQQSCSILTEERLLPDSGYLSTAQDIQNVVEYESSNCQDSGSVSHRRGAASSRHTFAFATVLHLSLICLYRMYCGYMMRPRVKLTIYSLWGVVRNRLVPK